MTLRFFIDDGAARSTYALSAPHRVQGRELRLIAGEPHVKARSVSEAKPGMPCRVWAYGHWVQAEVVCRLRTRIRVRLLFARRPARTRDCAPRDVWLRSTWPPGWPKGGQG